METMPLTPEQQAAIDIAQIGWRNIDWETWGRYRRQVWEQYTERLRLAATTTSNLSRFWSVLSAAMGIGQPQRPEDRVRLRELLGRSDARDILHVLRHETEIVVLAVRIASDDRKEQRRMLLEVQ